MRRDISRTLLVVSEQPQLWAAVRDRVPPSLALVRHATPDQLAAVWARADPWPWLVVGATAKVPAELPELLGDRPIPVLWLRANPGAALPDGGAVHATWATLAVRLDQLADLEVHGLRLAPRRGVRWGTLRVGGVPELEGLMAAHPAPLPAFERLRHVRRALSRHRLPVRLTVDGRCVRLSDRTP